MQFGSERPPENLSIAVPVSVPGANLSPFLCKPFVETSPKATYGTCIDPHFGEGGELLFSFHLVPSSATISSSATVAEVVTSTILDTSLSAKSKTGQTYAF